MAATLKVETRAVERGGAEVFVLAITGSMDAASVPDLDAAFAAALTQGAKNAVLDMGKVDYVSSAGLRLLLKLRKRALEGGGRILIAALHREIRENVFDALGFSRLFDVYGTAAEAVESFAGNPG